MTDPIHQSVSSQGPADSNSRAYRGLTLLLLALCLLVAALLRFSALDLMVYTTDAVKTVQQVSKVMDEGLFLTRAEMSSKGLPHPPLNVYLLAPAWAVAADPLALVWLISIWSVAAVGVTFWIGQRYLSPRAGLIAAACMAVSPWAVMFSRKIWRGDMIALFGALLIASTLALVIDGRRRAIFWVCLWAGVVSQIHPTGYPVVGAVLLYLALYRPRVSRPALISGLIVLTILYVPYGIFLSSGGWRLVHEFVSGKARCTGCGPPSFLLQQVEPLWHLVNLGNFPNIIGESSYYLDARLGAAALLLYPLAALERLGAIAGFAWLGWHTVSPRREPRLRSVGALLGLCILFLAASCFISRWRCPPGYYTVVLFAPFLALGGVVDRGLVHLRTRIGSVSRYRAAEGLVSLALAGALLTQVHFTAELLSLLSANGGARGDYGVAYRHKVALAEHIAQTYGTGCYRLNKEWRPLHMVGVRSREMDDLVRRRAAKRPCPTPTPVNLFVVETIDRPLSPMAEARLRPYRRFGPIVLYTKAADNVP